MAEARVRFPQGTTDFRLTRGGSGGSSALVERFVVQLLAYGGFAAFAVLY